MNYPTLLNYKYNVPQQFDKVVIAPVFAGGSVSARSFFAGNRSIVFPVTTPTAKLALRCWHRDPGNIGARYKATKSYLEPLNLPYFMDFGYIDEGIEINGSKYPISYIDWIEGQTLGAFIEESIKNQQNNIGNVAERFRTMIQDLHKHKVSHGDLQDGNIIVCPDRSLRLIDYDCLYVPTLKSTYKLNGLQGVPSYQHPGKRQGNETADYFSEQVIYLSLLAYAENKDLWIKGQEMRLLFSADDFLNPKTAPIFCTLTTGDFPEQIRFLAKELQKACTNPPNKLQPLEQVIKNVNSNVEVAFEKVRPRANRAEPFTPVIQVVKPVVSPIAIRSLEDFFPLPQKSVSPPHPMSIPIQEPPSPQIAPSQQLTLSKPSTSWSKAIIVCVVILLILVIIGGGIALKLLK